MAKKETKNTEDDASVNKKESKSTKASKESKPKKTTKKKEAKSATTDLKSKIIKDDSIEIVEASKQPKIEKSPKKFLEDFDWNN